MSKDKIVRVTFTKSFKESVDYVTNTYVPAPLQTPIMNA